MLENETIIGILKIVGANTKIIGLQNNISKGMLSILDIHTVQIGGLITVAIISCVVMVIFFGWLYKLSSDIEKLKRGEKKNDWWSSREIQGRAGR